MSGHRREGLVYNFKQLDPVVNPLDAKKATPENQYWKAYEFPTIVQEFGPVSHIDIRPFAPHNIIVSAASRIQVYSNDTNERIKTYSRFHDTVYGASYRSDGHLIIAGCEDAQLRLFDNDGRIPLRIFKGHAGPVHVSRFCNDKQHIFSASDDKTVRVWDVATERSVVRFAEHNDYIRTGAICKSTSDIIATGSYDHTVKMYDVRTKSSVLSVDHGMPVESILIHPSGSIVFSAGGSSIKVWDVLQGGKLLTTFKNHHKTITCLTFNHDYSRILSGSLDRNVKIYTTASYEVVHSMTYPGPILSVAVANEDKTLAVGMADKILSLRKRKTRDLDEAAEQFISDQVTKRNTRHVPGKDYAPNDDDIVIYHIQRQSLPEYERYFQKFEYSKALDATFPRKKKLVEPEVQVAVLKELIRRDGLEVALAGRRGPKLRRIIGFLSMNLVKSSFAPTILTVANALIDIYYPEIMEHTRGVQQDFIRLNKKVKNELRLHEVLYSVMGCIDAIFAMHAKANSKTSIQHGLEMTHR